MPAIRLARRRTITLAALADAAWLLQTPDSPLRRDVDAMLAAAGLRPPAVVVETVSIVATLALLQEGDAVTVMPQALARHYARFGMVTELAVTLTAPIGPLRTGHASTPGPVSCDAGVHRTC